MLTVRFSADDGDTHITGKTLTFVTDGNKEFNDMFSARTWGGYGNYVIKLIEIKGAEPAELHSWMVSVANRVMAEVSEHR